MTENRIDNDQILDFADCSDLAARCWDKKITGKGNTREECLRHGAKEKHSKQCMFAMRTDNVCETHTMTKMINVIMDNGTENVRIQWDEY